MKLLFLLLSFSMIFPVYANSLWSLSFDLGIPELIGTRIVRHSPGGSYIGFQPGCLVTLPAHFIVGNNTWAFTPGVFVGNDVYTRGATAFTMEIDITHGMSWGKYEDGGGFFVTPRGGLSIKKNRLLFRFLGGITISTIPTLGLPIDPRIIPSFLLEGGFFLNKSGWRSAGDENNILYSTPEESNRKADTLYPMSSIYQNLKDRKHLITTDPVSFLLHRNISLSYFFAVSKHIALGINPQITITDYSTLFGGAIGSDFYFRQTFYGWHIPVFTGIIPVRLKFTEKDLYTNSSTSITDAIYAFSIGTGLGYNLCFKPGFVIKPMAGVSYVKLISEPSQGFNDELWKKFSERHDDLTSSIPPVVFGLGCSVGWAF
jgi:hypothetical protein